MRLLAGLGTSTEYRGGYVSIGNFDGVHRGHQTMLGKLKQRAQDARVPAVVVTFDPHPSALLRPEAVPPLITTLAHRAELLAGYGIDYVIALEVNPQLLQRTAEQFFQEVVLQKLAARGLVEGPNFFFGRNRTGNVTVLKHFCSAAGMSLDVLAPVTVGDQLVSSSVIRSLLIDGDLDDAVELLGHPYRLSGIVETGARRGRLIGFPTANLGQIPTVLPGHGVYAGTVVVQQRQYSAAINIGPNPTFAEDVAKVEIHILGFDGDLYGSPLNVELKFRVRDVIKFASVDALQTQLKEDVQVVKQRLGG